MRVAQGLVSERLWMPQASRFSTVEWAEHLVFGLTIAGRKIGRPDRHNALLGDGALG